MLSGKLFRNGIILLQKLTLRISLWRAGGEGDHAAVSVFSHHAIVLRVLNK